VRFQQIYDYIESKKPHTLLEIGTWNGHNAVRCFVEGIQRYIGFDIFEEGDEVLDDLEHNAKKRQTLAEVRHFLKSYNCELIKGNTRQTLIEYAKGKQPFVDVAIIDGGHSTGTIKSDLLGVIPLMKSDGVIFLDDYYYECPTQHVGAQTVLCNVQIPYTVLPKGEKTRDGSIVKIVQINMRDVPRLSQHETPKEAAWQFQPAA